MDDHIFGVRLSALYDRATPSPGDPPFIEMMAGIRIHRPDRCAPAHLLGVNVFSNKTIRG
ncbi:hypothetical protein [Actinophytocola sp.]|uniref:hypothetical protein n=1 Tax=Actinophytocola sp. TaxID=1872138 RepID=UPI00389A262C